MDGFSHGVASGSNATLARLPALPTSEHRLSVESLVPAVRPMPSGPTTLQKTCATRVLHASWEGLGLVVRRYGPAATGISTGIRAATSS